MPSKVAGHVMELSNLPQANRLQKHSILVVLVLMSLFNTTSSLLRTTGFCTKGSLTTFVRPLSLYAESNGYSDLGDGFYSQTGPIISWYPGHIAKAERELSEYLKKVDVVIEVRDCRIPFATTHPSVPKWVGGKPLIVVVARIDQVSKRALSQWKNYYAQNPAHESKPGTKVFFIDGKVGQVLLSL